MNINDKQASNLYLLHNFILEQTITGINSDQK